MAFSQRVRKSCLTPVVYQVVVYSILHSTIPQGIGNPQINYANTSTGLSVVGNESIARIISRMSDVFVFASVKVWESKLLKVRFFISVVIPLWSGNKIFYYSFLPFDCWIHSSSLPIFFKKFSFRVSVTPLIVTCSSVII